MCADGVGSQEAKESYILLTAVWAKLPVLSDDRVGCQMLAPRLAREVENKATNKQVVRQWLHSQMDEPVGIL